MAVVHDEVGVDMLSRNLVDAAAAGKGISVVDFGGNGATFLSPYLP